MVDLVHYPALGRFGRLGNQLFQIATVACHAIRNGAEPRFPLWEYAHLFNVPEHWFVRSMTLGKDTYEPHFHYAPIPFTPGQTLVGYFQSPRYWEGFEEQVREWLTPRLKFAREYDRATVHVRRGDYVRCPNHHPCPTVSWYREAIERARDAGAGLVTVCSDDLAWCREHIVPLDRGIVLSQSSEVHDLALMTAHAFHVIANSSLSWWGAWLDPHPKLVIHPKQWFGPELADHDTRDLIPEGWVGL